jgi:hypothetical protein
VNEDPERADGGGFNQIEILTQLIEAIYHCSRVVYACQTAGRKVHRRIRSEQRYVLFGKKQ